MTVSAVGTPATPTATTASNSPSVTGTWGSGQSRTANDLLVAAVTAYGTTTAVLGSAPSGWALASATIANETTITAHYTRTATGSDSAPSFSATMTGTAGDAQIAVVLHEFSDSSGNTPVLVSTGLAVGTSGTITAATDIEVPVSGCLAVASAMCSHGTTSATTTWTTPSGWTLAGDQTASARSQMASYYSSSAPSSGSAASCLFTHGRTSTEQAASVVLIAPAGTTPGPMVVQHISDYQDTTTSATFPFAAPTAAGNALFAAIGTLENDASVSTVKLGSNADNWARQAGQSNAADEVCAIWMDPDNAGGSADIAITVSTSDDITVDIWEVTGLGTSPGLDVDSVNTQNGTITSWTSDASGTSAGASDFAIGIFVFGGTATPTVTPPSSPWVNETEIVAATGAVQQCGHQIATSAGTFTYSGTISGTNSSSFSSTVVAAFTGAVTLDASASQTVTPVQSASPPIPPVNFTSQPGLARPGASNPGSPTVVVTTTNTASATQTISLSQSAAAAVGTTATQTITATQSAAAVATHVTSASQALSLTQSASAAKAASASQTIAPSQSAAAVATHVASASQSLSLTQSAAAAAGTTAAQTLSLTQSATVDATHVTTASQTLAPSQSATALAGRPASASQTLAPSQTATVDATHVASAAQTISLTQSAAMATGTSASQTLAPSQSAAGAAVRSRSASQTIDLTQSAAGDALVPGSTTATQTLSLTQSAAASGIHGTTASQSLSLTQSAAAAAGTSAAQTIAPSQSATVQATHVAAADQTLGLTQSASAAKAIAAAQIIAPTQTATVQATHVASATQAIGLSQSAAVTAIRPASASQTVALTQSATVAGIHGTSATQTLVPSQTASAAPAVTATQTIATTQSAAVTAVRPASADQTVGLTQTAAAAVGTTAAQTITPSQSAAVAAAHTASADQTVSLTQSVSAAHGVWDDTASQTVAAAQSASAVAIGVASTWTASRQINGPGLAFGQPMNASLDCPVASSAGNWLIAFCSWTLPPGFLGCTMEVADDVHGWWIPLGAPDGDTPTDGFTRCSIWARPGGSSSNPVPGASHVYAAPAGMPGLVYPAVIGLTVIEVTGMSPYAGIPAVVTAVSNGATGITAGAPAPTAQALMVTVAASDQAVFTSGPGTGWAALSGVSVTGSTRAILHTSPAWQVATTSQAASWATGSTSDLSACTAIILTSNPAPTQPNPNWPYTQLQCAFGSGALTPRSQMTWTDISGRFLGGQEASVQRGKNRQLDQIQAAQISLTLDNRDSALDPGNTASPYWPYVVDDTPIRLLMTWEGRTYSQMFGYVSEWPQSWKDGTRQGLAQVNVTDSWSMLINQLAACQQAEILLTGPYAYWTCGDASGSAYAANYAAGNTNVLTVVESKQGALNAVADFGADSGADDGDPSGTLWSQSGLASGDNGYGYALMCADGNYPSLANTSGGITVIGWFNPTGGATQISADLCLMRASNAATGPMWQVDVINPAAGTDPGGIQVTVWDKVTREATNTVASAYDWLVAPLGGIFHVAMIVGETEWTLIINGASPAATGTCNLPPVMSWLSFMGTADRFSTGGMFNGECCHLAVFPEALPDDRVTQIVLAGYPQADGGQFPELPSSRIERLMGYGGWSGPRAISTTSQTQMAPITDIQGTAGQIAADGVITAGQGQQAGEAITNIVASDNGFMQVDGNGVLCYLSRADFYGQQPQWYVDEITTGGASPPESDISFSQDKSLLYNTAQLTQSIGTGIAVVATNVPSAQQHGQSPFTATVYQNDPDAVADEANWIVNTQGTPVNRFKQVSVNAGRNKANWPFVLGTEPGQPGQVTRRPVTAQNPTVVAGLAAQVTRKFDAMAGTAQVTITGDTFPEQDVLTADDPQLGQLNGVNRLGW